MLPEGSRAAEMMPDSFPIALGAPKGLWGAEETSSLTLAHRLP